VSLSTLIADTRKAVADDAANPKAIFSARGTLVGVTEVDAQTGAHTFTVDEPTALGGSDVAANDDTVRPGFSAVRVHVDVSGAESTERYQQLAAAVDEHCPVSTYSSTRCR
jgi:putative redox protein